MKFTPFGIRSQEFNRTVRGYDRDEVKAFLEKLSDEFERIQTENDKFKIEVERIEEQLKEYKKIEKNLQTAILSAAENSSKAVDSTKKQTALILKEAELKAAQLIENAKEAANNTRDSVLKLREEKKLLVARIKAMINTQASLLEFNVENIETKLKKNQTTKGTQQTDEQSEIDVDDILEKLL
ncbi:MAG: DivIVA family protein [Ignavibacteria bacterium]|nr:MAG: DivIVA family protein [Ignavibacteria bacterium]KAF0162461.1 MAG: DivIVA family protein [Ignavibacteria bacterium]